MLPYLKPYLRARKIEKRTHSWSKFPKKPYRKSNNTEIKQFPSEIETGIHRR